MGFRRRHDQQQPGSERTARVRGGRLLHRDPERHFAIDRTFLLRGRDHRHPAGRQLLDGADLRRRCGPIPRPDDLFAGGDDHRLGVGLRRSGQRSRQHFLRSGSDPCLFQPGLLQRHPDRDRTERLHLGEDQDRRDPALAGDRFSAAALQLRKCGTAFRPAIVGSHRGCGLGFRRCGQRSGQQRYAALDSSCLLDRRHFFGESDRHRCVRLPADRQQECGGDAQSLERRHSNTPGADRLRRRCGRSDRAAGGHRLELVERRHQRNDLRRRRGSVFRDGHRRQWLHLHSRCGLPRRHSPAERRDLGRRV